MGALRGGQVNPVLLSVIGAIGALAGWIMLIRTVVLGVSWLTAPDLERGERLRGVLVTAVISIVGFAFSALAPLERGSEVYRLPLVWFILPFPGWLMVFSVIMIAIRGVQIATAHDPATVRRHRNGIISFLVLIAGAAYWWSLDPTHAIHVLRGSIPMNGTVFGLLLVITLGGAAAMAFAARHTASRNIARNVVTQIALIAGSIVFGIPFVFLLLTSFKEDRDMASPTGIVWIPRVSLTEPYKDPKNPLFRTTFQGQSVEATILDQRPDGTVQMDVFRPLSIRGTTFTTQRESLTEIPRDAPVVTAKIGEITGRGIVIEELNDGRRRVQFSAPPAVKDEVRDYAPSEVEPIREIGLRVQNYSDALSYLPPETMGGLVYLKNTLILVILGVVGTVLSSSIVAYAFSRMQFPGRDVWFTILLGTMMLPGAVTLLPQFLIFRTFGWIDTLYPLWVPAFFGSAFNVFLLRQFFKGIPMELEDASKIDGCTYLRSFWSIMLPQIKPALAVIAIWTFMGAWNNFMGPLIYINSPENMPLSYALQLYQGDRGGEPGLLMAFATLTMLPVLALFFFMQRYFIEGVALSGLGGR